MRATRKWVGILVSAGLLVAVGAGLKGCSATYENRDPLGEAFPTVVGQSLEKERTELPGALAGEPAVVLIGYRQRTQFDIDRWIMGLLMAEVDAPLIEIPTIPGLVATFSSGWIDDGMRSGIPQEDWASVVTLYGKMRRRWPSSRARNVVT